MKSGQDPLSLTLTWFWRNNDVFLAGYDVLCVPVMPGSPCCSWHAEQPILQEPCSAHPTERGFCYIDVKTGFHRQASSLRIPSSPSSMTGCVPHVQVHTATYCQPGCLQGGGFSFFHSDIYRCYMMQALPTVFCEDGGKRGLLGLSLHGWKRRMSCHFQQQMQAAGLEGFVPLQMLPDLSNQPDPHHL